MTRLICDYETGMFALESPDETEVGKFFAHTDETKATAFHEAGHAVLQYALGQGLSRISLKTSIKEDEGEKYIGYHGVSYPAKDSYRRLIRVIDTGKFHARLSSFGVSTAAGPAAERKYRLMNDVPVRMRGGTAGDHKHIDDIAKQLEKTGRNRFAYRRLVWRRAQLALESPAIWGAVETLAMVLNELYWPDSEEVGEHECTMPGATALAIIRRAGVHPGMELPKKLPRGNRTGCFWEDSQWIKSDV